MADQTLRYNIEADDSKAEAAHKRTNAGLERIEKTAIQVGKTAGAALDAVTLSLVKSAEAAQAFGRTAKTFIEVFAAVTLAAKATTAYAIASENLLNTYRAVRLLIAPTLFTASTLAIGLAAEATIKLVVANQQLVDQQSLLAASTAKGSKFPDLESSYLQSRFRDVRTLSFAGQIGGGQDILGLGKSPDQLTKLIGQFKEIKDPLERARFAIREFGDEAEKALPLLTERLAANIARARELADAIDGPTRRSLAQLTSELQRPVEKLHEFADEMRYLEQLAKTGILIAVGTTLGTLRATGSTREKGLQLQEDELLRLRGLQRSEPFDMRDVLPGQIGRLGISPATSTASYADLQRAQGVAETYRERRSQLEGQKASDKAAFEKVRERFQLNASNPALQALDTQALLNAKAALTKSEAILEAMDARELAEKEAAALAKRIVTVLSENLRSAREALLGERASFAKGNVFQAPGVRDFNQINFERQRALDKAIDPEGNERQLADSAKLRQALEAINKAFDLKLLGLRRERFAKELEIANEFAVKEIEFREHLELEYSDRRGKIFADSEAIQIETIRRGEDYRLTTEEQGRDKSLRAVDLQGSSLLKQSVQQKIGLEQAKFEIEQTYLQKVEALQIDSLTRRTRLEIIQLQSALVLAGEKNQGAIDNVRITREARLAEQIGEVHQNSDAQVAAARDNAQINSTRIAIEQYQRQFDTIKSSAGQLFDAMLGGARSFADALRRVLIAGLLTPVKEAFSNTIAGIFTGRSAAGGGGGAGSGGGGGGILGGLLGLGAQASGFGYPGAPGGTSGFAGAVTTPGIIGGGALGIGGGGGGLGTVAQGGILAKLGLGAGATPGLLGLGAAALGLKGAFSIGQASQGNGLLGGAAGKALAPALGAVSGLVGFGSLAFLFPSLIAAGPAGWIAAAGIGAFIGIMGALKKTATQTAHDKIKSVYGVDITAKNILEQIVAIAKEGFGGNLDVAIRSPQIRDLVQLYSLSTGGRNFGPSGAQMGSFQQGGGSFSQLPTYSGGTGFYGSGSTLRNAGPTFIQLDGPATTALLRGEAVNVAKDSRLISASVQQANKSSQGRRSNAALTLSPGTLTS